MSTVFEQLDIFTHAGDVGETIRSNQNGSVGAMPAPRSILAEEEDDEFAEFADWVPPDQMLLVEVPPISASRALLDPEAITLREIPSSTMVHMQRSLSRAVWKPRFRNLSFVLEHDDVIIALLCLSSPVLNRMPPRDDYLGLPTDDTARGKALREYAELSVCVGVQPLAWYWNIGKLAALVATTLGDFWERSYGDPMLGVTTTSLWGKGAQYNRIYKHLGYTKGNGTVHVPDYVFAAMRARLTADGKLPDFGPSNTNVRPKLISAYSRHYGSKIRSFHGDQRAIYYHPAIDPSERREVIAGWFDRWGLPRYERVKDQEPPYADGRTVVGV